MKLAWPAASLLVAWASAAPASAASLERMARELARGLDRQENRKIAVLGFTYRGGAESLGSSVVQDRLTTLLAGEKGLEVIERKLLDQILLELRLETTGIVDPRMTHRIGSLLGVGAVVAGTLHDADNGVTEVHARVIQVGTGKILAAGMAEVLRTWKDLPVRAEPPFPPAPPVPRRARTPTWARSPEEEALFLRFFCP